ncbi:hypothetical protein [Actinomadura violacea]|uniref:Uncharacterized protein n=1 Tax=Actinomadura violacea TaxID=2819934 RepID=A0ABS3RXV8_9ACTN|nr:hypothetical protein [Actinomadura violacea]MBO2461596.1 hypothetical protein [Actinomadura violacea]
MTGCGLAVRAGAWLRRALAALAERLPHFPDPHATCPAHGDRYCQSCHANPGTCADGGECSYWAATGMHWDTCANRIR